MQGCRLLITFVSPHLSIVNSLPVIPFTEDLHVPLMSNNHHIRHWYIYKEKVQYISYLLQYKDIVI